MHRSTWELGTPKYRAYLNTYVSMKQQHNEVTENCQRCDKEIKTHQVVTRINIKMQYTVKEHVHIVNILHRNFAGKMGARRWTNRYQIGAKHTTLKIKLKSNKCKINVKWILNYYYAKVYSQTKYNFQKTGNTQRTL